MELMEYPVVRVAASRIRVNGHFKIKPPHYEFLNPPEGFEREVDLSKFFIAIGNKGHLVAIRDTAENREEAKRLGW